MDIEQSIVRLCELLCMSEGCISPLRKIRSREAESSVSSDRRSDGEVVMPLLKDRDFCIVD